MKWIITRDLINTSVGDRIKVGTFGGSHELAVALKAAKTDVERLRLRDNFGGEMNFRFRLLDDDGNLNYEGLCLNLDQQDGDSAFEPLDWAMNDVGSTTMMYRKFFDCNWKQL